MNRVSNYDENNELDEQFVYIFRDKRGNPIYVGRGRTSNRPFAHTSDRAHNDQLTALLKNISDYSIEISGPFGSERIAALVEGVVISAFNKTPALAKRLQNKNGGNSQAHFRPIGVPSEFADQATKVPLTKSDILNLTNGKRALLVYVNEKNFSDGRIGVNLVNPPSSEQIKERMVKWWQIGRSISKWKSNNEETPSILIAVSGTVHHRIVVGSLEINTTPTFLDWESNERGFWKIPTRFDDNLNYKNIRGRRLNQEISTFGGVPSKFYKII
jgi:hypothetical protein